MSFEEWFNEIEVFGLRAERFYLDLETYKEDNVQAKDVVIWLLAAYQAGHDHALSKLIDDGK